MNTEKIMESIKLLYIQKTEVEMSLKTTTLSNINKLSNLYINKLSNL